jgi:hypothetical protein
MTNLGLTMVTMMMIVFSRPVASRLANSSTTRIAKVARAASHDQRAWGAQHKCKPTIVVALFSCMHLLGGAMWWSDREEVAGGRWLERGNLLDFL